MSKEAQKRVVLTEEAQRKFEECVAAFVACGFGPDGPAVDTTFAEMEDFGHEIGRQVARAIEERLATRHAQYFRQEVQCPICKTPCAPQEEPVRRPLRTLDGEVSLHEPLYHCPVCRRDFFPSTRRLED